MRSRLATFVVTCAALSAPVVNAGVIGWTANSIGLTPNNTAQSFVSQAIGITNSGIVALTGATLYQQGGFGLGIIDVRGLPYNDYPMIRGVTDEGWVYGGLYYDLGSRFWGADINALTWDSVGGVSQSNLIYPGGTDPYATSSHTNNASKASAGLLAFAASLSLDVVAVNDAGQAAANTRTGQSVAYFLNPIFDSEPNRVSEPSSVLLVGLSLFALAGLRRQSRTARS